MELYREWRPVAFKEVYGQDAAVSVLKGLVSENSVPHAVTFTGPSGCGKTTLARILWDKVLCLHHGVRTIEDTGKDPKVLNLGFREINAASSKGIDTIRDIEIEMQTGHVGGRLRCYMLDECHKLTSDAQTALLKMLEDTPKHVYFFLCTTEPKKLLNTIRTRCTEVVLSPVTGKSLESAIADVCSPEKAGVVLAPAVIKKIIEVADGSVRKALVLVDQVRRLKSEAEMLDAVVADACERQAFDLVKMLLWEQATWPKIAELLKQLKAQEVDIEPLRHALLSCAFGELVKSEKRGGWCNLIIEEFGKPFFDSKWAGFGSACWNVMQIRTKR